MSESAREQGRRTSFPLLDRLGELCTTGRDSAAYLWQVPHDAGMREEISRKLVEIREECLRQNRREMVRIVDELETALQASVSPQQVEILQDGFDRLAKLWQSAKSGLM
ncbi:MAG: hypothetical protein ABI587_05060 [Gemmatimonadales bacterium]